MTESDATPTRARKSMSVSLSVPFPDMDEVTRSEESKAPCIGIDLGTTFSCVAVWKGGQVHVIPNSLGCRTTPSVVGFTGSERLVGQAASNAASSNAANTIFESKRLIGRTMLDRLVQEDCERFPFKVRAVHADVASKERGDEPTKPAFEVEYLGRTRVFHPEQIAAIILADLKLTAENFLDCPVHDAVVTVPAYFNDSQRQATKDAGTIAGLNVIRVINEPTAAALAYGLDLPGASHRSGPSTSALAASVSPMSSTGALTPDPSLDQKSAELPSDVDDDSSDSDSGTERRVLVFDLGGGTFDVSLLTIEDGFFEVKATSGDTHLGGEDFDNVIFEWACSELLKIHGKKDKLLPSDITGNPRAIRRLRSACASAKCLLSSQLETTISVPDLVMNLDCNLKLSRAKFESLCLPLFRRCMEPVEQVLRDAKWSRSDVGDVVLVGGSTRIPKLRAMLSDFFGGRKPYSRINPDEAVAYGAAIQAAVLSGVATTAEVEKLLLLDVVPLSLGVEMAGGEMSVVIPRNTPIPTSETKEYSTFNDEQTIVDIKVFEGERPLTIDNHILGTFQLIGIEPKPKGVPMISVSFSVDENGILSVTATETKSGIQSELMIADEKGRLTEELIEQMILEADEHAKEDELLKATLKSHSAFGVFLEAVKRCINTVQKYGDFSTDEDTTAEDASVKADDEEEQADSVGGGTISDLVKSGGSSSSSSSSESFLSVDESPGLLAKQSSDGSSSVVLSSLSDITSTVSKSEYQLLKKLYKEYHGTWQTCVTSIDSAPDIDKKQSELEQALGTKLTEIVKACYSKSSASLGHSKSAPLS